MVSESKDKTMGIFAISFRIHSDSTRQGRYDSLVEQIRECSAVWEETTSFALVESTETLSALEHRLYHRSDLIAAKDMLLVLQLSDDAAILRGENKYPNTLRRLRPKIMFLD